MRPNQTKLTKVLALLAACALFAAACGGSDDSSSTTTAGDGDTPTTTSADGDPPPTTAGDDPAPTTAAADDSARDPDGVVRYGYDLIGAAAGSFSLDPSTINTSLTNNGLLHSIYGGILRTDADGELVPELAESTDVPDPDTIVITLRDGLTFSDGSAFDAEAVKTGLNYTLENGDIAGLLEGFFNLESVEATDALTVTLSLAAGSAQSWHDSYLADWQTVIVKPGDDFSKPIGAGPFELTEYTPGQSMTLAKRADYWDADAILIGGIELTHVTESQATVSALAADQIDMGRIEPAQADGLSGDDETLFNPDPAALINYMICKRDAPLDNPDVRRALSLAIDRETISEALFGGAYEPALGIWPQGHPFHDPANEGTIDYDPEGARALLEAAGVADGFELDGYVIASGGLPQISEVLKAQWADIGVTVNLIPATNFVGDFLTAKAEGLGFIPVMGVPKTAQWSGDGIGNTCSYADPEVDDLAGQISLASGDELTGLWHQFEKLVLDQDLSGLLMFGGTTMGYSTDTLGGARVIGGAIPWIDARSTFVKA